MSKELDYIAINKQLWDKRTEAHVDSDFYDVAGFLEGKNVLPALDIELLGVITGKKILHLQCHFGMDSISLARLGADVTAVDFSEKAIEKANELNQKTGTNVCFIQSDVFELDNVLNDQFDIIYTSYGVLGWLPDMNKWAGIVQHFLKPGGELLLVEFHPIVWMFSYDYKTIEFKYMSSDAIVEELEGSYTDKSESVNEKSVGWNHGLSTVMSALMDKGLRVTHFNEYNESPYDCFGHTVESSKGIYKIKGLEDKIPLVYSLKAKK